MLLLGPLAMAALALVMVIGPCPADARSSMAAAEIGELRRAVLIYAEHQGQYPDSLQALTRLVGCGKPYLQRVPQDPWGRSYRYEKTPTGFRIISYGADGVPGGEGSNEDICSADLGKYKHP